MLQYVKSNKVRTSFNFLSWDLDLVVRMLTLREDHSLAYLFKEKMVVAFLACPYQISEFQAISMSTSTFSTHHILLKTHPAFCSKTQIFLILVI